MERKLAEQRAEAERSAREEAIRTETERRKALLQMADDHRTAQDIRTFVNDLLKALDQTAAKGLAANWVSWALGIADQLDPVSHIQLYDDGTIAMKPAAAAAASVCSDN